MPFSAPVLTYRAKGLASNIQSKVLTVHNTLININITAILAPEMTYTPIIFSISKIVFTISKIVFSISKIIFITNFVTHVRKFVTHITKFVIHVTKFVTNFFCADSEKYQEGRKK